MELKETSHEGNLNVKPSLVCPGQQHQNCYMHKNTNNRNSSGPLQMKKTNTSTWIHALNGGFTLILIYAPLLLLTPEGVSGTTFTIVNRCNYTVWPAISTSTGRSSLNDDGFELQRDTSRSFQTTGPWTGQFWGRTGCNFDPSGRGSCLTGDCGSGRVECNRSSTRALPVTLVEFATGVFNEQDFYDISLVDGYNLPVNVDAEGGSGLCQSTGCAVDLHQLCPEELKMKNEGKGCMGPCQAFGRAEYCCRELYGMSEMCRPNVYTELFKAACPRSYSYTFDDATGTFTCSGANYTITFCP